MKLINKKKALNVLVFIFFSCFHALHSDEGMWTFDNIPFQKIEKEYGIRLSKKVLENLQLSSVRFNDGGSGSFVSPKGLVITNHHVAMGQLQKMSTQKNNYVKNGYYAKFKKRELKCPDLELNVLVSYENVTEKVTSSLKQNEPYNEKLKKIKSKIATIEKESYDKYNLRSDVVKLYHGGEYWLYRYKKYTDIRLVMAPELQAASFGGDNDNFNYPRFALDYAFFRVYENGKPIKNKHFLKFSDKQLNEGELVLVSGHPGSTKRNKTLAQLKFMRNVSLPMYLDFLSKQKKVLEDYSQKGKENTRRVKGRIIGIENSQKALRGQLESLNDPQNFNILKNKEKSLKSKLETNDQLKKKYGNSWKNIRIAYKKLEKNYQKIFYERINGSRLANIATTIVSYVKELEKPNEERYEEFRDSNLKSLEHRLFSKAPIYKDLETLVLAHSLKESRQHLDKSNKFITKALQSKTIDELTKDLIQKTKLNRVSFRKKLIKGGMKNLKNSKDPLIQWALVVEPFLRENRDWYEKNIESVVTIESGKISKLKFKLYGKSSYPDATFTLRLSYGKVASYKVGDFHIPYKTTFYGLFDRAVSFSQKKPYNISERIGSRKNRIDLSTPLNFVTTNDITGGNSGSPVVDKSGKFVGIIFDGNCYSFILDYIFTENKARAVSVHSDAILESLKSVYSMYNLLNELKNQGL